MSKFNTSTNHPLIPNSQEYFVYDKILSIHSEDRDVVKYPSASDFEIELPQDYLNVRRVALSQYQFPAYYEQFNIENRNITINFQILPFNPSEVGISDPLQQAIFVALNSHFAQDFFVAIESGTYTANQMITELTNKFNQSVTDFIAVTINEEYLEAFLKQGGYTDFVIVFNEVSKKIWFGNRSSEFILTYSECSNESFYSEITCCYTKVGKEKIADGLPFLLGLIVPEQSRPALNYEPRFYYGDVKPGDNGYWITPNPDLSGCYVHVLESPNQIIFLNPVAYYVDISLLNNMDETYPFVPSAFTEITNETNGKVNSSFAKLVMANLLSSIPSSTYTGYDLINEAYKMFDPPAERIRRLRIKIRFHDGSLVNFGNKSFNLCLKFTLFSAQKKLGYNLTLI